MKRKHCEKTRKLLERYFDGELRRGQASYVEDHIADCAGCAREYELLRRMRGLVQISVRRAAEAQVDFARLWRGIEPRLAGPKPSFWERLGVAAREYLSVYKTLWATAAAAAAVAAIVAIPLLTREPAPGQGVVPRQTASQGPGCVIEAIESQGSTSMVYDIEDQTKVIWMFEDPEDPNEGPSSL